MNCPVVIADNLWSRHPWPDIFSGFTIIEQHRYQAGDNFCLHVFDDLFINYHWERLTTVPGEAVLLIYGDGRGAWSMSEDFSLRQTPPQFHVDGVRLGGLARVRRPGEELAGKSGVIAQKRWPTPRPAFFLDRDGILIADSHYLIDYSQAVIQKDLVRNLVGVAEADTLFFVVSNQSGVARGHFTPEQVEYLHLQLDQELQKLGMSIANWSFCPYHKTCGQGKWLKDSFSRKPWPGMVLALCERFPVDLDRSWMIGDQLTDQLLLPQLTTLHLQGKQDLSLAKSLVFSRPQELAEHIRQIQKSRS